MVKTQRQIAYTKLGKKIAFARRVRGISAKQFAESAEISCATLKELETGNGVIELPLDTLAMVLSALGRLNLPHNLADVNNVKLDQS